MQQTRFAYYWGTRILSDFSPCLCPLQAPRRRKPASPVKICAHPRFALDNRTPPSQTALQFLRHSTGEHERKRAPYENFRESWTLVLVTALSHCRLGQLPLFFEDSDTTERENRECLGSMQAGPGSCTGPHRGANSMAAIHFFCSL
jgi:hypothetical protein